MVLFQLIPFVHESDALAADFVEAIFVVHHFLAAGAGDDVVGAEIDGLLGADFLAHAAVDAADHVDIKFLRAFLNLGPFIIAGDFTRRDFDGLGRADEFAKLTGNTTLAIEFVGDEGGCATVVFRELVIPLLLGILHRDADAGGVEFVGATRFPMTDLKAWRRVTIIPLKMEPK